MSKGIKYAVAAISGVLFGAAIGIGVYITVSGQNDVQDTSSQTTNVGSQEEVQEIDIQPAEGSAAE